MRSNYRQLPHDQTKGPASIGPSTIVSVRSQVQVVHPPGRQNSSSKLHENGVAELLERTAETSVYGHRHGFVEYELSRTLQRIPLSSAEASPSICAEVKAAR